MKQLQTTGIILARTNYGEADRIITLLTPSSGKLRLMARGVRKARSKLAGGIELFSVSDLTYIEGRGDIGTLISSRLKHYYDQIVKDIDRVQLGYELIKTINKATEDQPEPEYFALLDQAFMALNDPTIDRSLIKSWFEAQLLKQAGHSPNLQTTVNGQKLAVEQNYIFDSEAMAFAPQSSGSYQPAHIKALRLLFSQHQPAALQKVQGIELLLPSLEPLIHAMLSAHIRT